MSRNCLAFTFFSLLCVCHMERIDSRGIVLCDWVVDSTHTMSQLWTTIKEATFVCESTNNGFIVLGRINAKNYCHFVYYVRLYLPAYIVVIENNAIVRRFCFSCFWRIFFPCVLFCIRRFFSSFFFLSFHSVVSLLKILCNIAMRKMTLFLFLKSIVSKQRKLRYKCQSIIFWRKFSYRHSVLFPIFRR